MRRAMLALALIPLCVPAVAQTPPMTVPGAPDVSRVVAGNYKADPNHTQVEWTVNHFGLSMFHGFFAESTGTLTLDPAHPAAAAVTMEIPIAKVLTTSAALNDGLRSPNFFDAAKYPTATFTSTKVVPTGTTATIYGNLTLHGVTKPVVLQASFTGAGDNPMSKTPTVGFEATGTIKRSDWGINQYVPLISDQVDLRITVAFERQR
ncbi:MAG: YceI family protein [Sphingomonadales bacterium]